ncbi:hypothetical protein IPM09_04220 [Candidatus Saccharibacteria bacterium]|nr:MAG: hypothetical protein IPM09_04220 [Candidatus Saccharibacteria bacterium]
MPYLYIISQLVLIVNLRGLVNTLHGEAQAATLVDASQQHVEVTLYARA